jgi:hypothetical protein
MSSEVAHGSRPSVGLVDQYLYDKPIFGHTHTPRHTHIPIGTRRTPVSENKKRFKRVLSLFFFFNGAFDTRKVVWPLCR